MFHAAGWTFPWSIPFSFATQVSSLCLLCIPASLNVDQTTLRTVDYSLIWKHFLGSRITHYCGAPTVQVPCFPKGDAQEMPDRQ
jgi:hypothetical protein